MKTDEPDAATKQSIEQAYASPTTSGSSLVRPYAKRFWAAFAVMSVGYVVSISFNLVLARQGAKVEPWMTFLIMVAFYWIAYLIDHRIRSARVNMLQWFCVAAMSILACLVAIFFFRSTIRTSQAYVQSLAMAWLLIMVAFVHLSNAITNSLVDLPGDEDGQPMQSRE